MKHLLASLLSLLCYFMLYSAAGAEELPIFTIMTEPWAPYQFEKAGEAHGISVDILLLILKESGSPQTRKDIHFYPWKRGYQTTLQQPNTLLFLTTRTQEREKLFKWVGPLFENTTCLIARKDKKLKVENETELNNYTFGVVRDDVGEQLLLSKGVKAENINRNTNNFNNVRMLNAGRLDFVAQSLSGFHNDALRLDINPDNFECSFVLNKDDVSYAFYRDTPDQVIDTLQKAFDTLKQQGKIKELFDRYQHQLIAR